MISFIISFEKIKGRPILLLTFAFYIGRDEKEARGRECALGIGLGWPPIHIRISPWGDLT